MYTLKKKNYARSPIFIPYLLRHKRKTFNNFMTCIYVKGIRGVNWKQKQLVKNEEEKTHQINISH